MEGNLPSPALQCRRKLTCIVQHEAEVQDPVLLEFREFIEADSPLELMQGLAEVNRTLLLEDTLEA